MFEIFSRLTKNFIYVLSIIYYCENNSPKFSYLIKFFLKSTKKEAIAMLDLIKQKHNEPKFDELSQMLCDLKNFLDEDVDFKNKQWVENLDAILDFQDLDGSFKLFDSYKIPSDARVDFCYMPTYICTAILMKAFMCDSDAFTIREMSALSAGLKMSCARNLTGHGYEGLKGQIEALNIFMKAGLREFIDFHPDISPEFTGMIEKIISNYKDKIVQSNFTGPWGESYEEDIKSVTHYFSQRSVFVYGTLMEGEANHGYLDNSTFLGNAVIEGYEMYDCGWYPAIVAGDGLVIGELYDVPLEDIPSIDMLEGEGSLYVKKCERISLNGNSTFAYVYIYLGDVSSLERIPSWKNDHLWYLSYGSNMLEERFMCYIEGGSFEGSRYHPPCSDTTPPLAVRAVELPYDMYFGHQSGSWQGKGVSFLDVTKSGKSLGVAYLITRKQFEHVVYRENSGRLQDRECGWYEDTIDLEVMDGFEVKTITNADIREYNEPSAEYWDTLIRGIHQHWPEMSDSEIVDYLKRCIR